MNISKIIRERRSIRRYKEGPINDSDLKMVLEAARWAPSGLNNQPWRFGVIREKEKKDALAGFTKYGYIIKNAPVVIVVCMDLKASYHREKDLMAIGACIQNMLLEAYSLGLGTCWLGEILNKKYQVCRYLNLNKDLELVALITLGRPQAAGKEPQREPLEKLQIN